MMKTTWRFRSLWMSRAMVMGAGLFAITLGVRAEDVVLFRISGPVSTWIWLMSRDGTLVWTNVATNATFTVQKAGVLRGGTNWVDYVQIPTMQRVTTNRLFDPQPPSGMALIPAGSFMMGATTNMGHESISFETPQHTVYVSAIYMDRYEVSKALWDEVYQWATNHSYSFDHSDSGQGKAANHPAHSMTWYDCVKWCNARSEKEGRVPAYYTDAGLSTRYRSGQVSPYVKWSTGYRLPTEAEWEKAARGGASGQRFPWGNTITHSLANYYSSSSYAYDTSPTQGNHPTFATGSSPYTSPVGYFSPNGYGLYDMAGNVWEWCWDWFSGNYYGLSPTSDPRGPSGPLSVRVLRGGYWYSYALSSRCALRSGLNPGSAGNDFGFRCVRGL